MVGEAEKEEGRLASAEDRHEPSVKDGPPGRRCRAHRLASRFEPWPPEEAAAKRHTSGLTQRTVYPSAQDKASLL